MFLRALGEGGAVAAALLVGFFLSLFVFGAMLRRRLARAPALLIAATLAVGRLLRGAPELRLAGGDPGGRLTGLRAADRGPGGRGRRRPRARRAGSAARGAPARAWALAAVAVVVLLALVSWPRYLSVRYLNRAEERAPPT